MAELDRELRSAARRFDDAADLAGRSLHVERIAGRPEIAYHYHEMCELVLLRGALGSRLVGDSFEDVTGRDLTLLGPALPHGWSVDPGGGPVEEQVEFVVVLFTRESVGLDLLAKPEMQAVRDLLDEASRGLAWQAETIDQVESQLLSLPGKTPAGQLLGLLEVLDRLGRLPARALVSPGYQGGDVQREHEALTRVLELVRREATEGIPLDRAARVVHMSVPTFTRFFRRMTGSSFVDYCNAWRIRRAQLLLTETEQRVVDVAVDCGFGNLSHFNRQFKRRVGCTPTRYRRSAR
jgi:AraC-like DNA-binding protein